MLYSLVPVYSSGTLCSRKCAIAIIYKRFELPLAIVLSVLYSVSKSLRRPTFRVALSLKLHSHFDFPVYTLLEAKCF